MSDVASSANTPLLQADIVLEGGGVRGIGHVGALSVLEEKGYHWVSVISQGHRDPPFRNAFRNVFETEL
jgi:hypothetical protein